MMNNRSCFTPAPTARSSPAKCSRGAQQASLRVAAALRPELGTPRRRVTAAECPRRDLRPRQQVRAAHPGGPAYARHSSMLARNSANGTIRRQSPRARRVQRLPRPDDASHPRRAHAACRMRRIGALLERFHADAAECLNEALAVFALARDRPRRCARWSRPLPLAAPKVR